MVNPRIFESVVVVVVDTLPVEQTLPLAALLLFEGFRIVIRGDSPQLCSAGGHGGQTG